ncbi:MAG: transcriptional regulator [Bradyrhizobium sp.]|nr:transcriptional regulator [Bradyrhizobium sp.]
MDKSTKIAALDFGFRATRISRRLRQLVDSELAAYGLTEATWRPLAYVGRLGAGVRQSELAVALGLEGPSLVRLLDNLERRGLIERREYKSDRRVRGIHLTPSGRELQRRVTSISDGVQQRLLAAASPVDLAACGRLFSLIEKALEQPLRAAKVA